MNYDQEHIYMLLLQKQLGEISEAEDKYLQKVMLADEQVRKCWEEQEEAKLYTQDAFLEDLRVEHDWCKIEAILKPKPVHTRVLLFLQKYKAVAAVFIFAISIAGAYFLLRPQKHTITATVSKYSPDVITAPKAPVSLQRLPLASVIKPTTVADTITGHTLPVIAALLSTTEDTATALPAMVKRISSDMIYQSSAVEWNTLTVPPQTDYHLELSDGTEVHLNASSTLRFPFIFPGRTREVYLEGEAYFTVAHNPGQPFIVHSGTTSVIALGTAFNINTYDNNTITTSLVQGSVITDVGDSLDVTLKPGYESIYRPGENFKVKRFDENITLAWREGLYHFREQPLKDLAPVMMRWFGLKLAFSKPALANTPFSGSLEKDKPVTAFLDSVCHDLKIEYRIYDGTVHFLR